MLKSKKCKIWATLWCIEIWSDSYQFVLFGGFKNYQQIKKVFVERAENIKMMSLVVEEVWEGLNEAEINEFCKQVENIYLMTMNQRWEVLAWAHWWKYFVKRSQESFEKRGVRFDKNSEPTKVKRAGSFRQNLIMFVKEDVPIEEENTVTAFKRFLDKKAHVAANDSKGIQWLQ